MAPREDDDDDGDGASKRRRRMRVRRMIHHKYVNMVLAWLSHGDDAGKSDGRIWKKKNKQPTNDDN